MATSLPLARPGLSLYQMADAIKFPPAGQTPDRTEELTLRLVRTLGGIPEHLQETWNCTLPVVNLVDRVFSTIQLNLGTEALRVWLSTPLP